MTPAAKTRLETLLDLFPPGDFAASFEEIPADQVPQPYAQLLVHEYHMTVTMEAFYRQAVTVDVLAERLSDHSYARKILLRLPKDDRAVQFGIVRIDLSYCSEGVRQAILERKTPLGRILIQHNVMRRIEPTAYLRIVPGPAMMEWFRLAQPTPTFGRLALIHCDGKPAVELLEIAAPV